MKLSLKRVRINAKVRVLAELYLVRISLYIAILGSIFAYTYFIGKVGEGITVLIAYSLLRWCFPTTWHHKKTLNCTIYSILIFCTLNTLALPFAVSLLSSVALSLALTYGLYKFQVLCDNQIIKRNFDVDNCTEEELVARCKELKMKSENIELAIEFFIKRKSRKELSEKYCIEQESIKQKKRRMKTQLNKED